MGQLQKGMHSTHGDVSRNLPDGSKYSALAALNKDTNLLKQSSRDKSDSHQIYVNLKGLKGSLMGSKEDEHSLSDGDHNGDK